MLASLRRSSTTAIQPLASAFQCLRTVCAASTDSLLIPLKATRGVISVQGSGILDFLQGLVTNDTRLLEKGDQQALYAALLTPKGRFLHDVFIHYNKGESDSSCFLDVDAASTEMVVKLLNRYKLRRPLQIKDASQEYSVWSELGPAGNPTTAGWPVDPRLPSLGSRTVLPASDTPASGSAEVGDPELYRSRRMELGVPEGDTEIPSGKAQPLEYNLDALNGISFHKGCYVGQERQSFTHFRGVIRKRLMPCRLLGAGDALVQTGAEVEVAGASGEAAGVIRAAAGDIALAQMRLAAALDPSVKLRVKGTEVAVQPYVPEFWPPEFSKLEEGNGQAGE